MIAYLWRMIIINKKKKDAHAMNITITAAVTAAPVVGAVPAVTATAPAVTAPAVTATATATATAPAVTATATTAATALALLLLRAILTFFFFPP